MTSNMFGKLQFGSTLNCEQSTVVSILHCHMLCWCSYLLIWSRNTCVHHYKSPHYGSVNEPERVTKSLITPWHLIITRQTPVCRFMKSTAHVRLHRTVSSNYPSAKSTNISADDILLYPRWRKPWLFKISNGRMAEKLHVMNCGVMH